MSCFWIGEKWSTEIMILAMGYTHTHTQTPTHIYVMYTHTHTLIHVCVCMDNCIWAATLRKLREFEIKNSNSIIFLNFFEIIISTFFSFFKLKFHSFWSLLPFHWVDARRYIYKKLLILCLLNGRLNYK